MRLRGEDYTELESGLDRKIVLAETILERLRSDRKLSDMLPEARFLAEMNEDAIKMAWLNNEIYGRENLPFAKRKQRTSEEQMGANIFNELHSIEGKELKNDAATDHKTVLNSISILELLSIYAYPKDEHPIFTADIIRSERNLRTALEVERILKAVRAAVYEYVSKVWLDSIEEKENLSLLGPDYKIVINNLDALETGVGQVLIAALDNLRTANPEKWNLAALGCRNVIIRLGDILWKAPNKTYPSKLDEKELDLVGEKEKNRLYAYIDYHYQRLKEQEHKDELKQLHGMVWRIWGMGSKAKRSVRHEEAKTIVIDTFEFVNNLDAITELKPLEEI